MVTALFSPLAIDSTSFDADPALLELFSAACTEGKKPAKIQKLLCQCERGVHTKRREIMNMRQKLRGHAQ